jgi:hypothetical protein
MNKIIVYSFAVCCFVFGSMLCCGCMDKKFSKYVGRQKDYAETQKEHIDEYESAENESAKKELFKKIKEDNERIVNLNNHYR